MGMQWITLLVAFFNSQSFKPTERMTVELRVGDNAPPFVATDDAQQPWRLADHLGKQMIVLYFYPADFTSGCERQADVWREQQKRLADLDVKVVGISADSAETHQLFKRARRLDFTLLSDESTAIAKSYGVRVRRGGKTRARDANGQALLDEQGNREIIARAATCCRSTFVIDRNGRIVFAQMNVKAIDDNKEVLAFLKTFAASEDRTSR